MVTIKTKPGSATEPQPENGRGIVIAHICNNVGAWGAGFVLAINELSMAPRNAYMSWAKEKNNKITLGLTQFVEARPNVIVSNMIAQNGIDKSAVPDGCLVDYQALHKCLLKTLRRAVQLNFDVHIPAGVGSGLAGGDKTKIHDLIQTAADQIVHELTCCNSQECCNGSGPELDITLWEFIDTTAKSFVPPKASAAVAVAPTVTENDL